MATTGCDYRKRGWDFVLGEVDNMKRTLWETKGFYIKNA